MNAEEARAMTTNAEERKREAKREKTLKYFEEFIFPEIKKKAEVGETHLFVKIELDVNEARNYLHELGYGVMNVEKEFSIFW